MTLADVFALAKDINPNGFCVVRCEIESFLGKDKVSWVYSNGKDSFTRPTLENLANQLLALREEKTTNPDEASLLLGVQ